MQSVISMEALPAALTDTITALDKSVGRPPFPNPAPAAAVELARALGDLTRLAQERNRLPSLRQTPAVTTTLPILCAALRQGSVDQQPCSVLCEVLLAAFAPVCTLSTYPLQSIVADMTAVLPARSVALFEFTVAAGALTPARTRALLGLSEPSPAPAPRRAAGAAAKGKAQAKGAAKTTRGGEGAAMVEGGARDGPQGPPPRELLRAMLAAPLDGPCREVLTSSLSTSTKFLALVGKDGEMAQLVLDVYGHVLLPTLKPASLLPCLDEQLLDNFVDLVHRHEERMQLLTDRAMVTGGAVAHWEVGRLQRLCRAARTRTMTAADAYGSLVMAVFLASVVVAAGPERADRGDEAVWRQCLEDVWEAAFAAAASTFTALSSLTASGGGAYDGLLSLAGNTVVVPAVEERWLRPLVLLHERTIAMAGEMYGDSSRTRRSSAQPFPGSATVRHFLSLAVVPSLKAVAACPPPSAPVKNSSDRRASRRGHGGALEKEEGRGARAGARQGEASPPTVTAAPLSFAVYLHEMADVVALATTLVRGPVGELQQGAVALAQGYELLSRLTPPQPIAGRAWNAFLDVVALVGWRWFHAIGDGAGVEAETWEGAIPLLMQEEALVRATRAVSCAAWVTPYLLLALGNESRDAGGSAVATGGVFTLPQALMDALLAVLLVKRTASGREPTDSATPTPPSRWPPSILLGLVVEALTDAQLEAALRAFVREDTIHATLPYLDGILEAYLSSPSGAVEDSAAVTSTHEPSLLQQWTPASLRGVSRLRERVADASAQRRDEGERRRDAEVADRRTRLMHRLDEESRLARERLDFERVRQQRTAPREQAAAEVRREYERRQEARQTRVAQERALRVVKRAEALATLQTMQTMSAAEREAARVARVARYRARTTNLFRVSVFLEHLQLVPSRLMRIRDELSAVMATITPDELLEYVVTGQARVPVDMLGGEGAEEIATPADKLDAVAAVSHPLSERAPATVDFWADVAKDAAALASESAPPDVQREGVRVPAQYEPRARPDPAPPVASATTRSFHRRAAPLLDLFSYSGGNEYGDLPSPLPSLKLNLAARAVPDEVLRECGFRSLRDAFFLLQDRGLVTVRDDRAQLTVLGFRYHFPYHDPEGMLEVLVHRNRRRILEAVRAHMTEGGGADEDAATEGGEWDEEDAEECDGYDTDDDQRILPEVEFSI